MFNFCLAIRGYHGGGIDNVTTRVTGGEARASWNCQLLPCYRGYAPLPWPPPIMLDKNPYVSLQSSIVENEPDTGWLKFYYMSFYQRLWKDDLDSGYFCRGG